MNYKREFWAGVAVAYLLVGCAGSQKDTEAYNKPAIHWYKKLATSVSNNNLEKADAFYISLKSEHMHSPLMQTSMMLLAHAHIKNEEYQLANFYLDEYNKRFGQSSKRDYIEFMKIKSAFLGITNAYKDQKLIVDSIKKARTFNYRYPSSVYAPMVNTMLIKLHMSQYLLNENIAALYDRIDKSKAAKIYREKNEGSLVESADINAPEKGFIGKIFD